MNRPHLYWKNAGAVFSKIHLVDKCLILFMLILLVQSAYCLFADSGIDSETNHIDIIIRTSSAAIFGYFLSANFIQRAASHESSDDTEDPETGSSGSRGDKKTPGGETREERMQVGEVRGEEIRNGERRLEEIRSGERQIKNRIGFVMTDSMPEREPETSAENTGKSAAEEVSAAGHLQILTAAAIGLFCLIVLILVRDAADWGVVMGPAATPVIAQFRDFVSGSVGFLIGCPTNRPADK